jgi:superfamily II DNA or RNA helicase
MSDYADFLASKARRHQSTGQPCDPTDVHPLLHGWQRDITAWAVRTGRAAIWADTGLGKTLIQLEWARLIGGDCALIVAPLAVCQQTVREATRIGLDVRYTRDGIPGEGLWITNYELAERADPHALTAVVLDEASILKQHDGVTRTRLIRHFAPVPYRLACTATPAPNDVAELANQAEFLGTATRVDMLAAYFINDPKTKGWRLKGHARRPMFTWMASWALAIRRPSDLGYPDDGYILPPLSIIGETVPTAGVAIEGQLFTVAGDIGGVGGRAKVRKATVDARCEQAAKLVANEPDEQWLLWCGRNDEADRLTALIPDAVEVRGNQSPEEKAEALLAFADGKIRYLVTKPSIASLGLNLQSCARMAFVGLSDSYEQYYQAIRRCWRYGQTRPVHAHVVLSDLEGPIAENVARKEQEASRLMAELVATMRGEGIAA